MCTQKVQLEKLHVRFIQQPWMGFFHKRGERWRHFNNTKINVHFQPCQDFKGGPLGFHLGAPVETTFWSVFVPKFISILYKLLKNEFLWALVAIKTKNIFNHVGEYFFRNGYLYASGAKETGLKIKENGKQPLHEAKPIKGFSFCWGEFIFQGQCSYVD